MRELHDITGSLAVTLLVCLVVMGMAAFQYAQIKGIVNIKRPLLVKIHFYLTPALFAVLLVHFFTTDKRPLILVAGVLIIAATALTGIALRLKKLRAHNFKPMVYMKIFLLCVALILTAAGHNALDEHRQNTNTQDTAD
ncbi:hypothetical protein [Seleniivibrio sp.]|uniref:hypothetical protein n=1 Tax=Seleniivibrio sp. TaxID=2898801 RepID=UPI0025DA2A25|nr:hypothetical protein [Seleniivibrio sp.]MCD8554828.1 hypothetical protein [Seleniivibrio sp.]